MSPISNSYVSIMNSDIQNRKEVACAMPKPAAEDLFPLPETHHNSASIPLEVPNELLSQAHNYTEMDFFALSRSNATINGDAISNISTRLNFEDFHIVAYYTLCTCSLLAATTLPTPFWVYLRVQRLW